MKRSELILLAVILFIGLSLRAYDLGGESIWYDEGYSVTTAKLSVGDILKNSVIEEDHPPIYTILLHYWINAFGDSETATRSLSLIFAFLAIFILWKLGSLLLDNQTALFAALVMALSTFHIHYSQEIRPYSIAFFLGLSSMYFFVKLLRKKTAADSAAYIISSLLLLYTHYSGFFIVLVQNIYLVVLTLLLKEKQSLGFKNWLVLQLLIVIFYMPWLFIAILRALRLKYVGFGVALPTLRMALDFLREYAGGIALLILYSALNIFSLLSTKNRNRLYLAILWFFVPFIAVFIFARYTFMVYASRFTLIAMPGLYFMIGMGIKNINHKKLKGLVIGVIIIFSVLSCVRYYAVDNKVPWRKIGRFLDLYARKGDLMLFNCKGCKENVSDYYVRRPDFVKKLFPGKEDPAGPEGSRMRITGLVGDSHIKLDEEIAEALKVMAKNYNRVWIMLSHDYDHRKILKKQFGDTYDLSYYELYPSFSYIDQKISNGVEVFLFERN